MHEEPLGARASRPHGQPRACGPLRAGRPRSQGARHLFRPSEAKPCRPVPPAGPWRERLRSRQRINGAFLRCRRGRSASRRAREPGRVPRRSARCGPAVRGWRTRGNAGSDRQRRSRDVARLCRIGRSERRRAGRPRSLESARGLAARAHPGWRRALSVRRPALAAVHPLGATCGSRISVTHRSPGAPGLRPLARLPGRHRIPRTPRSSAPRRPRQPLRYVCRSAVPVVVSRRRVLRRRL